MIKGYENKKIDTNIETPAGEVVLESHFFPKYQITIKASSRKDAIEKLQERLKLLENK